MATQARVIDLRKTKQMPEPPASVKRAIERDERRQPRRRANEPRREWMTAKMVSEYWGRSISTVSRRKIREVDPIPFHDGVVDRVEFDRWLERQPAGGKK